MRSSALLAAMLMAAPFAAADGTVELSNGIYVSFSAEGPRPWGGSVAGHPGDIVARGFTDAATCTYFGYEIAVRPADNGRIEVSLGPLTAEGEEDLRGQLLSGWRPECTSARMVTPAPRFPPPAVVGDGEGLSIDLLTNPRTGAIITDRIRVSRHPIVERGRSDGPVRDLRLEDLPLGVSPLGRLLIGGKRQANACGARGTLIHFWLPETRERFVFSLVPREGLDFKKVGVADVDRITFSWDGRRYQWIGEEPVVGPGVRCPVWVMRDDHEPAGHGRTGFACGAETPESLLRKR